MSDHEIPKHIGYIVDGNRRWAKLHGLPYYEGHLAGYNAVQEVVEATFNAGVKYITVYSFSTENWKRSKDEVNRLMGLVLRMLTADLEKFVNNNIRLKILGSLDNVPEKIIKAIDNAEAKTANNSGGTLGICFNYGGQLEIVDAVKKIIQSGTKVDDISPELISQNLYVPEIPPLDMLVRTSGEKRISNFMLWRSAYSELFFLDKMFPDMTKEDVSVIIEEYTNRSRRFGG